MPREKQIHVVIPAGTKVLTRPGGRVGIVAHAPAAPDHSYRIRYPDGPEQSLGKLRWAAKGRGKRGGARIIYLCVVIAARIYVLRRYAKNVKTDLTADEKKEIRQIAAHLKIAPHPEGVQ